MKKNFLIVLRHGETKWNIERKLQGQGDSELTKEGVQQARMAASALMSEKIDIIISSDLPRCVKTASMVNENLLVDVKYDKRLRERDFGMIQGLTKEEISVKYPTIQKKLENGNLNFNPPGGEHLSDIYKRVDDFMNDIALTYENQRILIVTHGGILDCIMRRTMNIPLEAGRTFTIFNTSINRFWLNDAVLKLETWGDIHHLKELQSMDDF